MQSNSGSPGSPFSAHTHAARRNASSDLDLLVDFDRTPSLFDLARMDRAIELALGVKIDAIPRDSLNPRYAPYIMAELVPV